jgi:hypothetical protein
MTTPNGTATGNTDAVRQSIFSNFFFAAPSLMSGIDAAPRVSSATDGSPLLGYGTTLGVDVGVGNNGEVYVRGQAAATGQTDSSVNGQAAAPAGLQLTPGLLLVVAVAAYLLLK